MCDATRDEMERSGRLELEDDDLRRGGTKVASGGWNEG